MVRFDVRLAIKAGIAGLILTFAQAAHAGSSQAEMVAEAQRTVSTFQKADPSIGRFFKGAAGYAVFPSVGKGGLVVGGAHGDGVVFANGKPIGKATLSQVSVGAQVGGQEFSQVIFFETPTALHQFMSGQFSLSAQVSAVALKSGAAANAKYANGVAVFTATKGGLMAEASVGGQKFGFEPFPVH